MAPTADTASAPPKQPRRTVPRIIPAVPFALSRAPPSARPITPEESAPETVTQPIAEPQLAEHDVDEQPADAIQAPLTPDSQGSAINHGLVEEETPVDSRAGSHDDALEKSLTRDAAKENQEAAPEDASSLSFTEPAAVNGEHFVAAPPAQLPAPFYPSEKLNTQTPTLESTDAPFPPPSAHFPSHRRHPSVEGLVFGATQQSPAMPSTPHELAADVATSQQPFARPPPSFVPPPFAQPFYPGHTHHPSDPPAPWMYPQYTVTPPASFHSQGRDYPPPEFSMGQVAYQVPYHGQLSQAHASLAVNGTTSSHSQSPIKSQFGETKPSSDYEEEPSAAPSYNGTSQLPVDAKCERSMFELAAYLSTQCGNPEFSDFVLQVRSEKNLLLYIPIHGIVAARSRVIAEAIHASTISTYRAKESQRIVDVLTFDRFVTVESLKEAIKALYGAPLLSVESFIYDLQPFHHDGDEGPASNNARKRMAQAISYAAAGRVLQIHSMQTRGFEIIKALLRWDNLDQAIHFGLDGSLTRIQSASRQNGAVPGQSHPAALDTFGIVPLQDVVEFIAYNFPAGFNLDTIAPELQHNPRLPSLVELRQSTHNPRLSRIRFGDAPPEDDLKPNYVDRILSSVLVSLPLSVLERLFSHHATANRLSWTRIVSIMRDIVDEREKRRLKALKSQIMPSQDGTVPKALLENLYWEERVESSPVHPSGFKLSETRMADHV